MPKISVIIPVYNVGKYIENSMKSVVSQHFTDFEVVLVDNNTPDDSIEIAENVLKKTKVDYRVVKQTIQGLPAARNMGIAQAKGGSLVLILTILYHPFFLKNSIVMQMKAVCLLYLENMTR